MPFALLYTSRNLVPTAEHEREIARILEVSLARNRALAVTGALVSTPERYAQILEGPRGAVMETMARIEADPGHGDIAVAAREMLPERSFARWSLAHIGTSEALEQAIDKLSAAGARPGPGDVWALWNLISELAYEQFKNDPTRST